MYCLHLYLARPLACIIFLLLLHSETSHRLVAGGGPPTEWSRDAARLAYFSVVISILGSFSVQLLDQFVVQM